MIRATQGKEIIIRTLNDIGVLEEVSKSIAERGVGIRAVSAWVEGADGIIHMVTDDNLRAMECLDQKLHARESGVVMVEIPNKPGSLRGIASDLKSEGIDIHHLYASALPNHERSLIVFASSNNDRALVLLNR